jgi:uncharacterized delta-60 repeat protein
VNVEGAEPVAVKQDANGNLFVIGGSTTGDIVIAHYLPTGALDQNFASGGILIDPGAGGSYDAAIDASGNLLVVISVPNGYSVRRYIYSSLTDGIAPDTAFNNNAKSSFSGLTIDRPDAVRIQSDGKILVSGDYISSRKVLGFAFRINPDGTTDSSFGSKGLVLLSNVVIARGAALQSVGMHQDLVLGGTASGGFAMTRLTPSGLIDTTFGTGGTTTTPFCSGAAIFGLGIDGSGNILAAGTAQLATNGAYKILVARYSANGALDNTFGDPSSSSGARTGTTVLDTFGGTNNVSQVAPDSSGRALVAGNGYSSSGKFLYIARYNSNGTLDSTFGSHGVAATNFGNENNFVMQLPASNLTIQSNGEPVVTGGATLTSGGSYVFGVARYWP